MKNKIILSLISLLITSPCVLAIQEGKVISDSATKKQVEASFDGIEHYTDNFFTPVIKKDAKSGENDLIIGNDGAPQRMLSSDNHGSMLPVKKLRLMIKKSREMKVKGKGQEQAVVDEVPKNQAILDCDVMEYFAERTELEADGHVVMVFPQNDSMIKADRVVYNQSSNLVKAFGNVVLINEGKELFGDYMQIDMNEENGFIDNPATDIFQIRARAKKGYMYGDKIIQEQGSIYVTKKTMINVENEMFGPNLKYMFAEDADKGYYKKEGHGDKFKIKTNDLIINSKKEHDTVTLKHAEIYFNDKKVGTIPTITMHTNKNQDYMEANYPELGTMTNMGMYAGPGFVFDTPMGTNLKIIPIVNYQTNSEAGESKLGFGAIAKFKSATNKVDFGYGTANEVFIMRGKQRLDNNLYLQYGANSYMDDWFMGFRMPRLMGELVYEDQYPFKSFLTKDLGMLFTQRIAAGYIQDGPVGSSNGLFDNNGAVGTARFKYMAEVAQLLYKFGDYTKNPINGTLSIVGQSSTAVYGTGDTQFVGRIGPRIHSQYKNWMQDAGYFLSAYDDKTPLKYFDQYMYGRSNVYMRETFRLNKYLALSWFGSLNLLQDSWDGKMLQENSFFVSIGPEDVKLHIGYDTIREQSFVSMALALDAKGSTLEYKKMIIKNPDTLGKDKNGNGQKQSFAPSSDDDDESGVEKAEVIDIAQEAF